MDALPLYALLPSDRHAVRGNVTMACARLERAVEKLPLRLRNVKEVLVPADMSATIDAVEMYLDRGDLDAKTWSTIAPRALIRCAARMKMPTSKLRTLMELVYHRVAVARAPVIAAAIQADAFARHTIRRGDAFEPWSFLRRVGLADTGNVVDVVDVKDVYHLFSQPGVFPKRVKFPGPDVILAKIPRVLTRVMERFSDHLVIAGGAVGSWLLPFLGYVENQDIDLFVHGCDQAMAVTIAAELNDGIRARYADAKCYRTGNAVTWTALAMPTIQLVARLYATPDEMLVGFDVAAASVLVCMNGVRAVEVWATPSFFAAVASGAVWVDPERQSETYAMRLIKYYARGWEVLVFGYDARRHCLNNLVNGKGLAKLFAIERKYFRTHFCDPHIVLKRESIMRALRNSYRRTSDYAATVPADVLHFPRFDARARAGMGVSSAVGDFDPRTMEWKTRDPGSQVTGSFSPLATPFYTGTLTVDYAT